jgi:hypothetical protein
MATCRKLSAGLPGPSRLSAFVGRPLHQLGCNVYQSWGATYLSVTTLGLAFMSVSQLALTGGLTFIGGAVVGSLLMDSYLAILLNVFHCH